MPRFAANLSMMYPELPFLDRFEAAAKDGFKAVEYLFPYAFAKEELVERLQANNLQQVLFNAPPGGTDAASIDRAWNGGDKGITCIPGREDEFRAGVALALDYAQALGCPRIHLMAGLLPAGVSREAAQRTYVANLRWAAAEAARHGRDVLIEPINTRDIPGFFLNRQDQAHALVPRWAHPTSRCRWTCTTARSSKATWPSRFASTCPPAASATSRSPACPSATSPTSAKSTTPTCSA
jgi:hydroxypyruvate isomerase